MGPVINRGILDVILDGSDGRRFNTWFEELEVQVAIHPPLSYSFLALYTTVNNSTKPFQKITIEIFEDMDQLYPGIHIVNHDGVTMLDFVFELRKEITSAMSVEQVHAL